MMAIKTHNLIKVHVANLRNAFYRYMKWINLERLKQEMNEVGPVTEHVFEANRATRNLKSFMRSENFTPEEVENQFSSYIVPNGEDSDAP